MANQPSSGTSKSSSGNKPTSSGSPGKSGSASTKSASSSKSDSGNDKSGVTRGGTREQHAEAGRQSHKNDDKK